MAEGRVVADRYRILRSLGAGGVGTVYEADTRDGRRVALKLLKATDRPDAVKRFEREARALIALDHPGIVRLLDVGRDGSMHFLALELVRGGSLQDRLGRQGPLPVEDALSIATKLAGALSSAHAAGVLHRDLKPDNVLLRDDGEPLLTDFGLTRDLDPSLSQTRLSRTGVCMGTPGYWAPELAHGLRDQVSPATDVYGLAAILYAMLSGQPPQGAAQNLMEAFANLERPVEPITRHRDDVPPWLDALLRRALTPEPSERPQSMLFIIDSFRAGNLGAGAPRPGPARSSTPAASARRPAGPKRVFGLLTLGVGLAGLTFVGFQFSKVLDERAEFRAREERWRETQASLRRMGIETSNSELTPPRSGALPLTIFGAGFGLVATGGVFLLGARRPQLHGVWEPWGRRLTGIVLVPLGVRASVKGVQLAIDARHENDMLQGVGMASAGVVLGVVLGLKLALQRPRVAETDGPAQPED